MKLDSLFITGGVHKDEFKSENKLKLINIIKKYKVKINFNVITFAMWLAHIIQVVLRMRYALVLMEWQSQKLV